jgi:hypothetical protein
MRPEINTLIPGVHNPSPFGASPGMMSTKKSMVGGMSHMPLTTRYETNKSMYNYRPQHNNTYRGKNQFL